MNLAKLIDEKRPAVIPPGWRPVPNLPEGAIYKITVGGLAVMVSFSTIEDGRKYLHISFSRPDRIPSWEEMRDALYDLPWVNCAKEIFMTLPPKQDYVNLNPNVMHWWQDRNNGKPPPPNGD